MEKMSLGLTGGLSRRHNYKYQQMRSRQHTDSQKNGKTPFDAFTKPGLGWEPVLPLPLLLYMNAQFPRPPFLPPGGFVVGTRRTSARLSHAVLMGEEMLRSLSGYYIAGLSNLI